MASHASDSAPQDTSAILARYVYETDSAALPPATTHAFKRSLLDYLGCTIAGMAAQSSHGMLRYYAETGASGACSVIGTARSLPPADAPVSA
jgi:2-methylcitrate dehydratase PrpD